MADQQAIYEAFLGTWQLIPESCQYEQGEPPKMGSYTIREKNDGLEFLMQWCDAQGEHHELSFFAIPDGKPIPFAGGKLADALSVSAPSPTELNSSAYLEGREISIAQRQLDSTRSAMRITQLVRIPVPLANVSIYRRVH
jgi:hypothetical protein